MARTRGIGASEGPHDLVAPAAAGRQVVLVEEDLLLAEEGVEVPGQGGRLVGAVAGAIADENASGHRSEGGVNSQTRIRKCCAFCDSASTPEGMRWIRRARRCSWSAPATPPAARSRALRARRPDRLRDAAQRRQARAAGRADPGRRRQGARLRVGRAQGGRRRDAVRAHRARDRADRGRGLQHRRQRALRHRRDDRARLPQGLGDGRAGRLSDGARGRQGDGAARPGTIIFTGATASMRGSAGFAAFAGAKHALRALAQSMARELGPKGIHVAHVVIDGAIDTRFIAGNFPERYKLKDTAASSARKRSPTTTGTSTARTRARGRTSSTCGRGWKAGEHDERHKANGRVLLRRRQPDHYLAWTRLPKIAARPARRSPGGRCCSAASSRRPAMPAR